MANEGTWPIDPTTPVGLFRFEIGDVNGTPTETAGEATYEFVSDATISALLLAYPDSRDTAKSLALHSMATQLIASAQDIQVDDIKIKTIERANLMFQVATALGGSAVAGEAAAVFSVVPLVSDTSYSADSWPYAESGF